MSEPIFRCNNCDKEYPRRNLARPECSHPGVTSLYKYVPFNEYSLQILINKEVWFPKAIDVNDPFEFKYTLERMEMDGIPINRESLEKARNDALQRGVFCLSEINDNILMWSHYTEGHKGFCIEFIRANDNDLGPNSCVPVIYPNDNAIPMIKNEDLETPNTFAKIATTKSKQWSYEREWRVISREIGGRTYPLPGKIASVIFGCRMSSQSKNTIINILGAEITYHEAYVSEDTYKVDINLMDNA